MQRFIIGLLAIFLLFFLAGCEADQKFEVEGAYFDLDDAETSSISISIPYIEVLSEDPDEITLKCYLSVFDQDNFPVMNLTEANFEFHYKYDDPDESFFCTTDFYLDNITSTPAATVITMDYSGSMSGSDIEQMEHAVNEYVLNKEPDDVIQIIKFASFVEEMNEFTMDTHKLLNAVNEPFNRGMTAFYDAVYLGLENLNKLLQGTGLGSYTPLVIAFTDGVDNYSVYDLDELIEFAGNLQIPVYTIGLGHVDETILSTIAVETGGFFQYTPDASKIGELFDLIHDHIDNLYEVVLPISNEDKERIYIKTRVFYENALGTHTAETERGYRLP